MCCPRDGVRSDGFYDKDEEGHLERTVGGSKPWPKNSTHNKSSPSRNCSGL